MVDCNSLNSTEVCRYIVCRFHYFAFSFSIEFEIKDTQNLFYGVRRKLKTSKPPVKGKSLIRSQTQREVNNMKTQKSLVQRENYKDSKSLVQGKSRKLKVFSKGNKNMKKAKPPMPMLRKKNADAIFLNREMFVTIQ